MQQGRKVRQTTVNLTYKRAAIRTRWLVGEKYVLAYSPDVWNMGDCYERDAWARRWLVQHELPVRSTVTMHRLYGVTSEPIGMVIDSTDPTKELQQQWPSVYPKPTSPPDSVA